MITRPWNFTNEVTRKGVDKPDKIEIRQLGEYEYDWHDYYKKKPMPSRRVFDTTFAVEGI